MGGSVNRKRFDEYAQSFKGLMVRNCYNRRTKSDVLPLPFHKQPFSEQSKNIRSQNRTEDGENNSLRFLTLIMNQRCENPGKLIRRDLGLRSAYILDTAKDAPFLYLAIIIAVTRFYFFYKMPRNGCKQQNPLLKHLISFPSVSYRPPRGFSRFARQQQIHHHTSSTCIETKPYLCASFYEISCFSAQISVETLLMT